MWNSANACNKGKHLTSTCTCSMLWKNDQCAIPWWKHCTVKRKKRIFCVLKTQQKFCKFKHAQNQEIHVFYVLGRKQHQNGSKSLSFFVPHQFAGKNVSNSAGFCAVPISRKKRFKKRNFLCHSNFRKKSVQIAWVFVLHHLEEKPF